MGTSWKVIGRGFNGWHAKSESCSSSGGDLVDREWWAGGIQEGYLSNAAEGALVYDAENADSAAFVRFVMSGPMVDVSLPPDGEDRFTQRDRDAALRMSPALEGGYKALAVVAQSPTYSGLDRVGVGIYERLLREVPGVKIGKVRGGEVAWE